MKPNVHNLYRAATYTRPRSAVGNVSGKRCESDCRSRVTNLISAWSITFVKIDHEIISTVILLPSAESFKKGVVSYKGKYVPEVLVNCLFKLAQEKVWLGELTVPIMPIAVGLERQATKQTNKQTIPMSKDTQARKIYKLYTQERKMYRLYLCLKIHKQVKCT